MSRQGIELKDMSIFVIYAIGCILLIDDYCCLRLHGWIWWMEIEDDGKISSVEKSSMRVNSCVL